MKLLTIQFLRGWAGIIVVAYHSRGLTTKPAIWDRCRTCILLGYGITSLLFTKL